MRYWRHHSSEEWMEARHGLLTASAITTSRGGGLVAANKKYVPGKLNKDFVKLWMKVNSDGYDECDSTGWAARGHIMEPYAISEFNMMVKEHGYEIPVMSHWDDTVIVSGPCGFSPDGLDIEQTGKYLSPRIDVVDMPKNRQPHRMIEIKSYTPEQHAAKYVEGMHPERWQMAFGMFVMPTIKEGYLVFYCPGSPIPLHFTIYTREKLEKELDTIREIVSRYLWTDGQMTKDAESAGQAHYKEDAIYEQWVSSHDELYSLR